jgi:predicted nucleic acid-binding protein
VIVVDASVLAPALVDDAEDGDRARAEIAGQDLAAPHLVDCEVASVIRRACLRGDVSPRRATQALDDLADMPILRFPHTDFLTRIWELHPTLTPYDAAYVALAEVLESTLITADRRLARASGPTCRFTVVE